MIKFDSIEWLEESYGLTFRGDDHVEVEWYINNAIDLSINLETLMVYNHEGDYIADAVKLSDVQI